MAEPIEIDAPIECNRRYPKRRRVVSSHLEPYVIDYNSDEDLDDSKENDDFQSDSESLSSLSESENPTSMSESLTVLWMNLPQKLTMQLHPMEQFGLGLIHCQNY